MAGGDSKLIIAMRALVHWLEENRTPYAVVGGVAAGVLGRPRSTKDVDVVAAIPIDVVEVALRQAGGFGFVPANKDALPLARKIRILQMLHKKTRTYIDVILASTPFESRIISSAGKRDAGSFTYKLVSPEYLLAMKVISGRPQDLLDCVDIIKYQDAIDWNLIEREVSGWGEVMERAGCLETLEHVRQQAQA